MNTIFNFALIPFIGAFGASIATMLEYMAIWVIRTIQLRKIKNNLYESCLVITNYWIFYSFDAMCSIIDI